MSLEVVSSFFTRRFLGTLTGGFFYDVHHSLLVNTIHFYFWLFLFLFPLSLYSAGTDNTFNIIFYTILIGVLFFLIKFGAFYLKRAFAHEQKIKESKTSDKPEADAHVETPEDAPIKDSKREEPISTNDITIVEDTPRLTFQEPPATTIPEKKTEPPFSRSDEIKRRDKRHKIEEESDDSTTVVHSSFTATRKSKTSTGAVLGERDSEISSTLDKETSVPWLTEEDTSMKEFSEEDLSDNEPKGTHSQDNKESKHNTNTTATTTTTTTTITAQPTENPFADNLLEDIRNYAFDDFAFYDESAFTTMTRRPIPSLPTIDSSNDTNNDEIKIEKIAEPKEKKPDTIVSLLGKDIALPFDRLFLNHLLDTDDHWFEALLAVALATTCAYLGFRLSPFFHEFALVMLWYIVACAQYSLLKSPQPDSCSPRHDFNKLNAYNRSFYFILIAMSILLLKDSLRHYDNSIFIMYNIEFSVHRATEISLSVLLNVLPYFPLIYLFGLLPQCNTLIMYIIEQLNIHAFGGSGSTNIRASLFDFLRSWTIIAIIYGIGFASKFEHNFLFSLYLGIMVGLSLLHSRLVTDPIQLWNMTSTMGGLINLNQEVSLITPVSPQSDSPAATLSNYPKKRLVADLVISLCAAVIATALHATTVFYYMWPYAFYALAIFGCVVGFTSRYAFQVLRKPFPWNLFQEPILESLEHKMFEPKDAPSSIMWFEKLALVFNTSEQMIFYPLLFLTAITEGVDILLSKFSLEMTVLITSIVGLKLFRGCFGDTSKHYLILFFSLLFFKYDLQLHQETFMIDFFFASILVIKIDEAILKMNFILVYVSPIKMSWGSVAHVILQPLAVPHFVVTLFQVLASSVISAPLYPFIGSTVFLTGYGRPMRFWEREYKTNRVDNSQIKLSEALDNSSETEENANNLNSIFYEHLVGSLQKTLYKEIQSGRFGNVSSGDFYIIVNDRLTALLHIIDISNGHCTFQLRGMEFKGTYCQERELEAINRQDYTNGDDNRLFPEPLGKLPKLLSFKNMLGFRWRSWEVVNTSLMLQTYSISLNAASQLINVYSLRMVLIKCYVKAAIFYLIQSSSLESWLSDPVISSHLSSIKKEYVDYDPIFTSQIDEDFDVIKDGISIQSFNNIYGKWIQTCLLKRIERSKKNEKFLKENDWEVGNSLFNFCFAISLLARRCLLVGASDSTSSYTFMSRFHSLFKGDFRITSTKDEFVLADPDIMHKVLGKAIRISLRLHQDHFIGEEYDDPEELFNAIEEHEKSIVCCHEGDPLWRKSVLNDVPMLLSLRKQTDSTAADYNDHMILSLTLRYMKFRVIKLNREGVRGLWAGQVQELVFLGNTNAERGSIQQMRTVVRNLINQSCDFPVGYPIYVSPLTTSYSSFWSDVLNGVYYPSFLSSIWAKGHL